MIPEYSLDVLIDGLDFAEAPRWYGGRLLFSDFFQHEVRAVGLDGHVETLAVVAQQPSGLGHLPDGRLLIVSMRDQRILRRERDGSLATHADLSAHLPADVELNDMVVDASGNAYVGCLDTVPPYGRFLPVFHVSPTGSVAIGAPDRHCPNGAVITPDCKTLIVGETLARRFSAYEIGEDGRLGSGRLWADLGETMPDGCTLDAEGAIWVADPYMREFVRVREGGEITDRISVPEHAIACALGGDDGKTLFLLTSRFIGEEEAGGAGGARVLMTRVDVPHAGFP